FARVSIPEALVNRGEVAASEELWRAHVWTVRTSAGRPEWSHTGLHVPIRRPASIIVNIELRQPGVPAENAGDLPTAENGVHSGMSIAYQRPALAERAVTDRIRTDVVTDTEVAA